MYVCMYICHTLISVGGLVALAHKHDVHVVALTLTMQAQMDPDGTWAVSMWLC